MITRPTAASVIAGFPLVPTGKLESFRRLHRPCVSNAAGVERGCRLEQENVGFAGGNGLVLDAAWNDEELPGIEPHDTPSQVDVEVTVDDEEELVFAGVPVPDELTLQLGELDVLTVELADDSRAPALRELPQLLGEIHLLQDGLLPRYSQRRTDAL
jgi:hypothetical protein